MGSCSEYFLLRQFSLSLSREISHPCWLNRGQKRHRYNLGRHVHAMGDFHREAKHLMIAERSGLVGAMQDLKHHSFQENISKDEYIETSCDQAQASWRGI